MKILLDTHALLWSLLTPAFLGPVAAALIADPGTGIMVSAVTAWEIATKVRLGKLPGAERVEREFLSLMDAAGYTLLPIDAAIALRAGRLPGEHRDPFDRMLAAQALADDMPVVSIDRQLDALGVRRVW